VYATIAMRRATRCFGLATSCFYWIGKALQTKAACVAGGFNEILPSVSKDVIEPWFVYIVECGDGSLYTGIAKDVQARIEIHNKGKGAKYTRGRGPVRIKASSGPHNKSQALSLEAQIKRLPAQRKVETLKKQA
jgi:putative endonuclease